MRLPTRCKQSRNISSHSQLDLKWSEVRTFNSNNNRWLNVGLLGPGRPVEEPRLGGERFDLVRTEVVNPATSKPGLGQRLEDNPGWPVQWLIVSQTGVTLCYVIHPTPQRPCRYKGITLKQLKLGVVNYSWNNSPEKTPVAKFFINHITLDSIGDISLVLSSQILTEPNYFHHCGKLHFYHADIFRFQTFQFFKFICLFPTINRERWMMLVIMLLSEGASHNAQITKSDGIVDNLQGSHGPAVMQHPVLCSPDITTLHF